MKRAAATFKRVASYFEEVAKFQPGVDYESSGSEHSSESELSDLVNSFMERDIYGGNVTYPIEEAVEEEDDDEAANNKGEEVDKSSISNSKRKDELEGLLGRNQNDPNVNIILEEMKNALLLKDLDEVVGDNYSTLGFMRSLMNRLREKGLDAGLCKSKWEKPDQVLAGDHEYIDVNIAGTRYIVEVNLAGQFQIARPSRQYAALIETLPSIYAGKVEDLKQIVKLMCADIKKSMKSNELLLAPWRRNCYMQLKWFGAYRRTTNAVSAKKMSGNGDVSYRKKVVVGFKISSSPADCCRDQFVEKKKKKKKDVGMCDCEFLFSTDNVY